METKILKAVFGGGTSTVTNKRTRTDYGQVLEIIGIDLPDTFECIFSNSATSAGTGKKMIGSSQRVLIPDEYLTTGQTIYAWILLHDTEDDGRHMYSVRIPVADMPDTSPEEPTPVEQSVISQAITALNSAVTTTTQKAQEATESADRAEQAAEGVEAYVERAETAQSASESARDRATQAETSARTSAATASEKASEAISSATTASQSAITAENASESASASADASAQSALRASQFAVDASVRAHNASEYAQTASGYASNANTSAQTASQKASEAAQSASTAVQAKTDAETAKQASETAQGLAESARDGAVSAKTVAESARDEAQSIADGITGKVEQIDSNTDRIESLEDDRYKPYAVDSASGSIASFPDGADGIPLKSCIVQVEPVQEGSGDPSPDNVRPISGFTGCEVQRTGKNLWGGSVSDSPSGKRVVIGYGKTGGYPRLNKTIKPNVYTLSVVCNLLSGTTQESWAKSNNIRAWFKSAIDGKWYYIANASDGTLRESTSGGSAIFTWTTTPDLTVTPTRFTSAPFKLTIPVSCIAIGFFKSGNYLEYSAVQLEVGESSMDIEPYTGHTYPITFPTEAGTVYGGYVDVINGELTVDMAQIASYNGETLPSTWISDRDVYASGTTPTIGAQVVYKLAEPIHYPITSSQINSLYGQNNLWANTGDVSVEYRADTTLYISRLTEPGADMVADANITSGSYFMVGNDLYRATVNIASGSQVIEGTNATRVSLATALNEINA